MERRNPSGAVEPDPVGMFGKRGVDGSRVTAAPSRRTVPSPQRASRQVEVDVWDVAEAKVPQTRSAERFVPRRTATVLTTAKGRKLDARIVNLSAKAVAVEANMSLLGPDEIVMVGSRPVNKGRSIALGMVFFFNKPIDPSLCNPDVIL